MDLSPTALTRRLSSVAGVRSVICDAKTGGPMNFTVVRSNPKAADPALDDLERRLKEDGLVRPYQIRRV